MDEEVLPKKSGVRAVWIAALSEAMTSLDLLSPQFPEVIADPLSWPDWYEFLRHSALAEIRPNQWRALGQRLAVRSSTFPGPFSLLISPSRLTRLSLRVLLPHLARGIPIRVEKPALDQLRIVANFPGGPVPPAWSELFAGILEGIPLNLSLTASRATMTQEEGTWVFLLELPSSRTLLARSTGIFQILGSRKRVLATLVRQQSALAQRFQELQILYEEQARLEADVQRAADHERDKLAFDLHDGLGQLLTGISLHSQALANNLSSDQQAAHHVENAAQLAQFVSEANRRARLLSRGLNPVSEFEGGLSEALRALCEDLSPHHEIDCQIISTPPVLNRSQEIQLYRIAQEALNNALKHSRASVITLELTKTYLLIRDQGCGFDLDQVHQSRTLGLRSMKYRAKIIGAHLQVSSNPELGTTISITFPYPSENL